MKKYLLTFIILCVFSLFSGCNQRTPNYTPGVYEGQSEGYYSNIKVSVEVDEYHIINIEILSHEEPEILSTIVFKELPPRIIKQNGTDIDVISGATFTSLSLLDAVEKALIVARL